MHIPKQEKQPWSYLEKSWNSQPIKCPLLTGISLTRRNKSVKWNIAEVICDSLLNGPFKRTPHPFESSNKFCFGSNLAASNQSRKWLQARGTSSTPPNTQDRAAHCEASCRKPHKHTAVPQPTVETNPSFLTLQPCLSYLSFTARWASFLSPHISNPLPHKHSCSWMKPRGAWANHPLYFLWKELDGPKGFLTTMMPPPSPVIASLASSNPPGDCECTVTQTTLPRLLSPGSLGTTLSRELSTLQMIAINT